MASNNPDSLRNKAITGAFWQLLQKGSVQLVSFVVSVILARLIDPTEFGIVAMASIFMAVAGTITDGGLGTSLVQRKEIDELDQDTVFHFGMLLAAFMYTILFFSAPLISRMYKTEELTLIVRIASLSLFATSFNSVQGALVMRQMDFKKYFWANLAATLISAAVGITMAYMGYGVWALVAQNLTRSVAAVLVLFILVRWLPKLQFSWARLKILYSFGLNLMGANLIGTFFNELRGFLIGLRFQPADLAFFNRGNSIPGLINDNVNGTISTVLFPAISKLQDDRTAIKSSIRHAMMTSVFIMAPLMILLAASSRQIILLLYTDKWIQAVPFMQVIVFYHLFSIVGLANLQALNAIGRSDITFKLEFVKKPILLAILLYTATISPLALSIGTAIYAIIGAGINAYPNRKLIGYSYREQIADVLPQILISIPPGIIVWFIGFLPWNTLIVLSLQILLGGGLYYLIARLLHLESYQYSVETISNYLSNLRQR